MNSYFSYLTLHLKSLVSNETYDLSGTGSIGLPLYTTDKQNSNDEFLN